mmetsp:Transcript_80452/g.232419  ORF Transcript_80452/g.232419 Transcript_80452/m.232419 type:complete len:235 (-) Transcript_80452:2389-3093(-)
MPLQPLAVFGFHQLNSWATRFRRILLSLRQPFQGDDIVDVRPNLNVGRGSKTKQRFEVLSRLSILQWKLHTVQQTLPEDVQTLVPQATNLGFKGTEASVNLRKPQLRLTDGPAQFADGGLAGVLLLLELVPRGLQLHHLVFGHRLWNLGFAGFQTCNLRFTVCRFCRRVAGLALGDRLTQQLNLGIENSSLLLEGADPRLSILNAMPGVPFEFKNVVDAHFLTQACKMLRNNLA